MVPTETKKIVFLDFDGVMTPELSDRSWLELTREIALLGGAQNKGGETATLKHQQIYQTYLAKEQVSQNDVRKAVLAVINLWQELIRFPLTIEEFDNLINRVVNKLITPGIKQFIDNLINNGFTPIIVSASCDLIIAKVGEILGIDFSFNSEFLFDEDDNFISFTYDPNVEQLKLTQIQQWANSYGVSLDQCYLIEDNYWQKIATMLNFILISAPGHKIEGIITIATLQEFIDSLKT